MKKILLFLILAIVFFGCPDVSETPSMPDAELAEGPFYFNFNVEPNFIKSGNQTYIFLHDSDGELINYSEVKNGEEYRWEIKSNTPHHFTIYHILYSVDIPIGYDEDGEVIKGPGSKSHVFHTYTSLPIDQQVVLSRERLLSRIAFGEPTEKVEITVNHNTPGLSLYLSDETGSISWWALGMDKGISKTTFSKYNGIKEHLLVAMDTAGLCKYKLIPDIDVSSTYTFDYNEFSNFDFSIPVDVSKHYNVSGLVVGMREIDNKLLPSFHTSNIYPSSHPNPEIIRLEYLKEFPYNYTRIVVEDEYGIPSIEYENLLKSPKEINLAIPEPFQLINKKINNLKFTKIQGTNCYTSYWDYNGQTILNDYAYWSITSNTNESLKLNFPSDIVDQLPFLEDLDNFELKRIVQVKSTISYHDYLKLSFFQKTTLQEYEFYSFIKDYNINPNSRQVSPSILDSLLFLEP